MAASDGGRSESSNDSARTSAPTGPAPLVKDAASAARVQEAIGSQRASWRSFLPMATTSAMWRAVRAATPSRVSTVRFALGVPMGLVLSMVISAIVAPFYPLTAPMSFFLTLSTTMATGLLFAAGFPLKDAFTTAERLQLERHKAIYVERKAAIDERARQMLEHGMSGSEIEAELGPEWRRVREDYDDAIAGFETTNGATQPALSARPLENPPRSPRT